MVGKRGTTAYFVFCEEHRDAARAEVTASAGEGAKVSVATVAKALGDKWRQLSDDEKDSYKRIAVERSAAMAEAVEAEGDEAPSGAQAEMADGDEQGLAEAASSSAVLPFGLPTSLVKRIMCLDEDVGRMSADSIRAVSKAAQLFMQELAAKSATAVRSARRRNIKFADIERAVCGDKRMVDMGLKEILSTEATFAEARGEVTGGHAVEKENTEEQLSSKKTGKRKAEDLQGNRHITDFFKV